MRRTTLMTSDVCTVYIYIMYIYRSLQIKDTDTCLGVVETLIHTKENHRDAVTLLFTLHMNTKEFKSHRTACPCQTARHTHTPVINVVKTSPFGLSSVYKSITISPSVVSNRTAMSRRLRHQPNNYCACASTRVAHIASQHR